MMTLESRFDALLAQTTLTITPTQQRQLLGLVELLDSLGKRIRFIRQVVLELGLTNVTPVQSRVEAYQPEQGFDGVLSRAFASLADMLHWCHHLPAATGCFLALKGQYPHEELASLPAGFVLQSVHPLQVPELDGERHLVIVKKQS